MAVDRVVRGVVGVVEVDVRGVWIAINSVE